MAVFELTTALAMLVSGAESPALHDTPAEAEGRRILSTAFVRIGPDGWLTVTRRDGDVFALRDVTMRPRKYCGTTAAGKSYCDRYDAVVAARPGKD